MTLLEIRHAQRAAMDKIEALALEIRITARDVGLDTFASEAQALQMKAAALAARLAIQISASERDERTA